MTLNELKIFIKQHFGYPMVKVELHDDQLTSMIERAYKFHLKWGIGHSSQETFFTKRISAGQREYTLPNGVHNVISVYDQSSNLGGSQELFSIQNAIYQQWNMGADKFSIIDYQLSMQYIDLLEKYNVSRYAWKYNQFNNKILLSPTPSTSGSSYSTYENQFMLIRCFIEEGYRLDDNTIQDPDWREFLYEDPWFQDYCIALCKIILGHTRRKLANMSSLSNMSISLDGDSLVSEGKDEKESLETELKEDTFEGLEISYD